MPVNSLYFLYNLSKLASSNSVTYNLSLHCEQTPIFCSTLTFTFLYSSFSSFIINYSTFSLHFEQYIFLFSILIILSPNQITHPYEMIYKLILLKDYSKRT